MQALLKEKWKVNSTENKQINIECSHGIKTENKK